MLFVHYIYYCVLFAISLILIWILLTILQFILNKYYGTRRFRFAEIYYHDINQDNYNRI
jgi:hypothetical protein